MLPIIGEIYTLLAGKEKDYIAEIVGRTPSTLQSERTLGVGGAGYMKEWNAAGGTAAGAFQDVDKGWETIYTHKKYVDARAIERDWSDDKQYKKIATEVKNLRRGGYNTQQYHFAEFLNSAVSGASAYFGDMTLADGFPLAYTAHTYNEAGTGGTFSNLSTSCGLSAVNLEARRTTILTGWKDDAGNLLNIDPDDFLLVVPTALRKTALVIADSDGEPDTTDNNVNVWNGAIKVLEMPRLTSATTWFIVVRSQAQQLCHWYDRRNLDLSNTVDFLSEQIWSKIIGRWSLGSDCAPAWLYVCTA
jgi:hypothetical protein